MKRFAKYWAIRLLGREFMAMSSYEKAAGLWWITSLFLLCGWCDTNPLWSHLVVAVNFTFSCALHMWTERHRRRKQRR